jgi:hypothetical protein
MSDFDPYHQWLGIPLQEQPAHHYRLLGITDFESNRGVISTAAERQTVFLRTLQAGEHEILVAQLLNEISQARVTLLNADQKTAYDEELRKQQAPEPVPKPTPIPVVQPRAPTPVVVRGTVAQQFPVSVVQPTKIPRRRRQKEIWQRPVVIGVSLAAGLIGMGALVIFFNKPIDDSVATTDDTQQTTSTNNGGSTDGSNNTNTNNGNGGNGNTVPSKTGNSQFITDDGQSLWQSPTSGNLVNLAWSPPAGQLFIAIQVEELLKSPVANDILISLGPAFQKHLSTWEATTGFKLQDIKQLVLSWRDEDGGAFPTASIVVHLKAEVTAQQILETLGNPSPEETEFGTLHQASTWSYLVPESGGLFVMGTKSAMTDTLELKGNPPLISRTLKQLVKQSDRERHLTILFAPSFLFTTLFRDGHEFYFGEPSKIRDPLRWLLGDELEAAMVSLHFDSVLYIEARMTAGLTVDKRELVTQLNDRMGELHDKIEAHMVTLNPSPYWRALAFRFPAMVAFLHEQTRIQIEDKTPVLNIALPIQAASNLIVASELSLASTPGAGGVPVNNGPMLPKTIEEVLKYPFSVDIPQQDLNLAIADIANEVRSSLPGLPFKFELNIAGNDLMQEGITRNQAIRDFAIKDKSLAEVLTGIVMKANPDRTVTSPSMPNQKLIWLITTDPNDPGNKIILITTRKAAVTNNYTLPLVFVE